MSFGYDVTAKIIPSDIGAAGVIYCITNTVNGKRYVGQSMNAAVTRFRSHSEKCNLKTGSALTKAIFKYGKSSFDFKVVCFVTTEEKLDKYEKLLINKLGTLTHGYNLKPGGRAYGRHTQATKDRISASKKANKAKWTKERRERMTKLLKGKPKSKEHVAKVAAANRGKSKPISVIKKHKIYMTKKYGKAIIAVNLITKEEIRFKSIRECSRQLSLVSRAYINKVLNGEYSSYNNWTFKRG